MSHSVLFYIISITSNREGVGGCIAVCSKVEIKY